MVRWCNERNTQEGALTLHLLWLNPYHAGSHAAVASGYAARSQHRVTLLTLPHQGGWRWRMRSAAVTFARMVRALPTPPDLLITTDMLDLATFRALTRDCYGAHLPAALYMHENQLTYPLPPGRTRDLSFAWINYTSMLAADAVFFNSDFHRHSLLAAVREWLSRYHDYQELEQVDAIAAKAQVLPPGIDLAALDVAAPVQAAHADPHTTAAPIILWNSRWEYDKQPEAFFAALEELEQRGADFHLIVAGEHVDPAAPDFAAARRRWAQRVLHWGYAPQHAAYARLLHQADVVVSSAIQEFFGIGVIEALSCGCIPVLPRRLSYPELLPPEHHADCLYPAADALAAHLHTTLQRREELRRRDWRAIAAPYDWAHMAPRYDAAFASVQGIGARR